MLYWGKVLSVILVNFADGVGKMSVCTFFGHRDCPGTIRPSLRKALVDLIQAHSVTFFYVGCQGGL